MSSSSSSATTTITTERELPMLAAIGGAIRWIEELAAMLAGPILTAGLGIALIDLLTDGQLLVSVPWLLFAWAVSQAVGLDAQIVGSSSRVAGAFRAHRWWPVAGYGFLIVALGYVAFLASNVFATQQAQGISTAQALAQLGMDRTLWIIQRSALSVLLVIVSGMLRYRPPMERKTVEQLRYEREMEVARLEHEAALKAKRAEVNATVRAAQVRGLRSTVEALRDRQSTEDDTPQDDGPGGGITPQSSSDEIPPSYGDLVRITPRATSAVNNRSSGGPARQSSVNLPLHRRVAQSGVITVADLVEALHIGEAQARSYLSPIASPPRDGQRRAPRIEAPVDDVLAYLRAGRSAAMKLHAQTLDAALHPRRTARRDRQSSADGIAGRVASQTPVDRAGWHVINQRSGAGDDPQSDADGVPQSDGELVNA